MTTPTIGSWKEHFLKMARGRLPVDDNVIVVHRGRGLGRIAYQRAAYKIRDHVATTMPPASIVSPVAQGVLQAQAKKAKEKGAIKGTSKKGKVTNKKSVKKAGDHKKKDKKKEKDAKKSKKSKT